MRRKKTRDLLFWEGSIVNLYFLKPYTIIISILSGTNLDRVLYI